MEMITVVVINWKRPDNVRLIGEALSGSRAHRILVNAGDGDWSGLFDAVYQVENEGGWNRYRIAEYIDTEFALFWDDDLLPGPRFLDQHLDAATKIGTFGILSSFGRLITETGYVDAGIGPVDFGVRTYLYRTEILKQLLKVQAPIQRWFADDIWMGYIASMSGFKSFRIPVDTRNLPEGPYALRVRPEAKMRRVQFIQTLITRGWDANLLRNLGRIK